MPAIARKFVYDKSKGGVIEIKKKRTKVMKVSTALWPLHSEAAAVNPEHVGRAMEDAREKGVPTEFDAIGCPIFTGPGHRKAYLERVAGLYDRNGGYGDPMTNENSRDERPSDSELKEDYGWLEDVVRD